MVSAIILYNNFFIALYIINNLIIINKVYIILFCKLLLRAVLLLGILLFYYHLCIRFKGCIEIWKTVHFWFEFKNEKGFRLYKRKSYTLFGSVYLLGYNRTLFLIYRTNIFWISITLTKFTKKFERSILLFFKFRYSYHPKWINYFCLQKRQTVILPCQKIIEYNYYDYELWVPT